MKVEKRMKNFGFSDYEIEGMIELHGTKRVYDVIQYTIRMKAHNPKAYICKAMLMKWKVPIANYFDDV